MSFREPTGVLGELCARARERVEASRRTPLPRRIERTAPFCFRAALTSAGRFPLICEVKRASPSAGTLRRGVDVKAQARAYEAAGAAAVSVLTEPSRFLGSTEDLLRVRAAVSIPLLRKDFVVDPFMVDEAHAYGADAVLLIAAALSPATLVACADRADALGLDCLLELIYLRDLEALALRPWAVVGINARDLETLEMVPGRFASLAGDARAPGRTLVAESGLSSLEAIRQARSHGADAALIGEALMLSESPGTLIREWSVA